MLLPPLMEIDFSDAFYRERISALAHAGCDPSIADALLIADALRDYLRAPAQFGVKLPFSTLSIQ
jgi:hypothetical protein